jgi:hypothetical protein
MPEKIMVHNIQRNVRSESEVTQGTWRGAESIKVMGNGNQKRNGELGGFHWANFVKM